jgi:hypothetical protein
MARRKKGRSRVSEKISHLVRSEGVPQKQAVAMSLNMERAGRLRRGGKYVPVGRHRGRRVRNPRRR